MPTAREPVPFGVGKQNLKREPSVGWSGSAEKRRFLSEIPRQRRAATAQHHQTLTKMPQI
jgi:hypothetical protein